MLAEIEAGHVEVVITKDLSRLGRNSSLTGLYINYTFPQYGVRYIAINDHFDTIVPNSTDSDMAGIKNWFNEWYSKDTSRKICAINKAKGERGERLTTNVPYGYKRDSDDPKKWVIDEESAQVVKRIFALCMEGKGPSQIAALLTSSNTWSTQAARSISRPIPTPFMTRSSGRIQWRIAGFSITRTRQEQYVLRSGVLQRLQAKALLLHHQLF